MHAERLGDGDDAAAEEQGDRAAGSASSASSIRELEQRMAQQQAAGQADTVAAARSDHTARAPAGVGHGDGDTHARRQQDAWAQQVCVCVLGGGGDACLQAAAVCRWALRWVLLAATHMEHAPTHAQEATARLQDIDEAAVAANPDSAGHPEQHRVRRDGQFDDS
jgi:hypothetical protein